METVIITGGTIVPQFLQSYLSSHPSAKLIAADAGVDVCMKLQKKPNLIVGDFDSATPSSIAAITEWKKQGVTVYELPSVKDETDTEAAIRLALETYEGTITIFGASGSRIDHLLGNISLLGLGLSKQRPIILLDPHNRIRLLDSDFVMNKHEQFGSFISFFSVFGKVTGLTLTGFRYPLTDFTLEGFHTLCVSNEIEKETAYVSFKSGLLLMIESSDCPIYDGAF